jgi:alpha-galactosidase
VDLFKIDFMTPGSPDAGETFPANNLLAAVAYYNAIQQAGRKVRVELFWKVDRNSFADFEIW